MSATLKTGPLLTGPRASGRAAADLLHGARAQERAARISDAIASYEAAITTAEGAGEPEPLAVAIAALLHAIKTEEDTSELQSLTKLVFRLLLETKTTTELL